MKSDAGDALMMIEPALPAAAGPVVDEITRRVAASWRDHRRVSEHGYRGFHRCSCGATSDNRDHFIATRDGGELKTNSLLLHYLAYHRDEVPAAEFAKVAEQLFDCEAIPSEKALAPPRLSARSGSTLPEIVIETRRGLPRRLLIDGREVPVASIVYSYRAAERNMPYLTIEIPATKIAVRDVDEVELGG